MPSNKAEALRLQITSRQIRDENRMLVTKLFWGKVPVFVIDLEEIYIEIKQVEKFSLNFTVSPQHVLFADLRYLLNGEDTKKELSKRVKNKALENAESLYSWIDNSIWAFFVKREKNGSLAIFIQVYGVDLNKVS